MTEVERRTQWTAWPDVMEWFEHGVPNLFRSPFLTSVAGVRIEEKVTDDHYLIKAELPGIDPDKDVEITVANGILTVRGERKEEHREETRSEFRYGSFLRRMTLPDDADANDVTAKYSDGILEIRVARKPAIEAEAPRIPIKKG